MLNTSSLLTPFPQGMHGFVCHQLMVLDVVISSSVSLD